MSHEPDDVDARRAGGVEPSQLFAHHAQLTKGTVILAYAGKGKETDPPLIGLSPSSGIKGIQRNKSLCTRFWVVSTI